jgi:isocitrate/isopropylmalate dehydrogenase
MSLWRKFKRLFTRKQRSTHNHTITISDADANANADIVESTRLILQETQKQAKDTYPTLKYKMMIIDNIDSPFIDDPTYHLRVMRTTTN